MSELYNSLKQRVEEIKKVSDPLRKEKEKLDAELAPIRAKIQEISKKIREAEKELPELVAALVPLEKQEAKRLKAKYPKWEKDGEKQTLTKDDVGILDLSKT